MTLLRTQPGGETSRDLMDGPILRPKEREVFRAQPRILPVRALEKISIPHSSRISSRFSKSRRLANISATLKLRGVRKMLLLVARVPLQQPLGVFGWVV